MRLIPRLSACNDFIVATALDAFAAAAQWPLALEAFDGGDLVCHGAALGAAAKGAASEPLMELLVPHSHIEGAYAYIWEIYGVIDEIYNIIYIYDLYIKIMLIFVHMYILYKNVF